MDQQVTCKIALVSFGSACSARMASLVGTVSHCNLATSVWGSNTRFRSH